jgi:NAD(P)-dependent dehydrogenase (short-subunit alcohol dehydrogenase family)
MSKNAVVTGAGSGVGQATAIALAKQGWRVAILGRRIETLKETMALAKAPESQMQAFACDIGDSDAVAAVGKKIFDLFGSVDALVNAAGTNAPARALEVLSLKDYHEMIDTNMNGAYYCVQAFLPGMRARRSGTIVNVVSEAALAASPKAGPAYVMSKFGMRGLTQAINAEEKPNGVRACALLPGDIDTPLLQKRPNPPPPEARAKMLRSEDVAECVMLVINLPPRAVVEELLLRPAG